MATTVWPYDSMLHFHSHVDTQHFSSYFELSQHLSVFCGLYLGTSISTRVGEGVRVSERAHRENLTQELAKEGSHLVYEY